METMTVLAAFEEYEGETRVRREKGDEITVSASRADELRERGLARKKPAGRKVADEDRTEPGPEQIPETAPKA